MRNASRFLRLTLELKRKKKCPTLRHKWKGIHLDLEWISNKLPERLISLSRSFQTGYNDKRSILFEENHVLRSPNFFTCTVNKMAFCNQKDYRYFCLQEPIKMM
mmetsp:Transcript_11240/g.27009  ORF Transcript_11240/g.27009 Transcript_11240/m.27009 type:complete len:104 (+) Transcript_11240:1799-2110(+)